MINKLFLSLLLMIAVSVKSQNSFISLKNITTHGVTDTVDLAPILIDTAGKVVVSGNEKITGSQYDASTAQQLTNGIMTWTAGFNLSTQKCWVTSNVCDAKNNIIVTGGVATGTTNGVDLFVIKYNSSGTVIWSYTYNGPNSTMDVGTSVIVDANMDVYVCGASDSTLTSLVDYVTIKINGNTGSQIWESRYNYNDSYDAPVAIVYNTATDNVEVTGASGTNFTDWDIATIAYDYLTGVKQWENRTNNPGGNQDKAFSLAADTLGNVYVAGTTWNGGNGTYDISVQKLDTALNMVWIQSFDANGLDDAGINLALDANLNIYVTGTSYYSGTNKQLIVLKYDNNGTLKWSKKKLPQGGTDAEGIRIKVKSNNQIFVGGNFNANSNQDIAIMRYDSLGHQTLEKIYNGPQNNKDKFLDFVLNTDSNFIYVSGRTYAGGSLDSNITLVLKYDDFPFNMVNYNGSPARTENELLVKFQQNAIKDEVVNNVHVVHGVLSDFLTPLAMTTLDSNFSTSVANLPCYKIFPSLVLSDSLSLTRSGRTVKMSHFWTTLGVFLPSGSPDTMMLNYFNNSYKVVNYAEFNGIITQNASANDPEYTNGNSAALITTTAYPNANINIEPAWDIAVGNPNVKVGIFDTGINFTHQDFGNGTFAGSKIAGGRDYYAGNWNFGGVPLDMINSNDPKGHGTAIAGIIGAIRNNSFAISGIAGGDATASPTNVGVSLYDMKTHTIAPGYCSSNYATDSRMANAIFDGAHKWIDGFGQHVQNHSWTNGLFPKKIIHEQLSFAFDNEVVLAFTSGNDEDPDYPCTVLYYPGNFADRMIMQVGANDTTGNKAAFSQCGGQLDFIAPGVQSLYTSLTHTGSGLTDYMVYDGGLCTQGITGTSFAAPQAAGVAALMISYANNTPGVPNSLYPEDIEEIMQLSAKDLTVTPYSIGPDGYTGSGRIDAGQSLQGIKYPNYVVKHYSVSVSPTTSVLQATNEVSCIMNNYYQLPQGIYNVWRYKVTAIASHTIPAGHSLIGKWERDAGSNLKGLITALSATCGNFMNMPSHFIPNVNDITSTITATGATLTGYYYRIIPPSGATNYWYPSYPDSTITLAYTLYLKNNAVSIKENIITEHALSIYPNPANDKIFISSHLTEITEIKLTVFDILGRTMLNETNMKLAENSSIDVSQFKNGVYFFNLTNGGRKIVKKIIINH